MRSKEFDASRSSMKDGKETTHKAGDNPAFSVLIKRYNSLPALLGNWKDEFPKNIISFSWTFERP